MRWFLASAGVGAFVVAMPASAQMRVAPIQVQPTAVKPVIDARVLSRVEFNRVAVDGPVAALPNADVVTGTDILTTIERLPVRRELSANEMRGTKALDVGIAKVDLSTYFDKPSALPNIARRLESMASVAKVNAIDTRAFVLDRGVVVRSLLNYELKSGTCSNPSARAQVQATGLSCAVRLTDPQKTGEYSNPRSPRYVADPVRRTAAIARARSDWLKQDAKLASEIGKFRAALADPTERAKLGPDGDRLAALNDDDLAGEIINHAEVKIEDVMFIPAADEGDSGVSSAAAMLRDYRSQIGNIQPSKVVKNQPIDKVVFLTGFTLGREYEWSKRIEKTIKWCWVGCAETYYAGGKAGASYGFGLRFPIVLDGKYENITESGTQRAFLTANFAPVNGNEEQYLASGLSPTQLFKGQEFVAQLGGFAGYEYRLPLIGSDARRIDVGYDLAAELPAPYEHGQFTPPEPGGSPTDLVYVFDKFDLLQHYGNWGAAGVVAYAAVRAGLTSRKLEFTVHDNVLGTDQQIVNGKRLPLGVDTSNGMSSFSIGAPVYNLGFTVEPGVQIKAFIDLSVWGDSWTFDMWFPQVAITLPPGGIDFACHANTICKRDYFYTADTRAAFTGAQGAAMADLVSWATQFQADWAAACPDGACGDTIAALRAATERTLKSQIETGSTSIDGGKASAIAKAKQIVYPAQDKVVTTATSAAKPYCSDDLCAPLLDKLAQSTIGWMGERRAANPSTPWRDLSPRVVDGLKNDISDILTNSQFRATKANIPQLPVIPKVGSEDGAVKVNIPTDTQEPQQLTPIRLRPKFKPERGR